MVEETTNKHIDGRQPEHYGENGITNQEIIAFFSFRIFQILNSESERKQTYQKETEIAPSVGRLANKAIHTISFAKMESIARCNIPLLPQVGGLKEIVIKQQTCGGQHKN